MHYVLADDLSGALEAGAAFRVRGHRVVLPLQTDAGGFAAAASDVTVISTETRNARPNEARVTLTRILRAQNAAGGRLLFKKIDSTLRGPVGAEVEALITELAPPLVIFCPANPRVGRTVVGGVLHVHGVPLEKTDFARDPLWPATTGDIAQLLTAQGVGEVSHLSAAELRAAAGRAEAISALLRGRTGVVIADAETMDDLRALALLTKGSAREVVVGSGAFGEVLAARLETPVVRPAALTPTVRSVLVISGSRHPATHAQLEWLRQSPEWVVLEADVASENPDRVAGTVAKHLASTSRVAVRFLYSRTTPDAAHELIAAIGRIVARVFEETRPDALFVTGGETAWEICRSLGGRYVRLHGELAPGVAFGELVTAEGGVVLITKPGGYGDASTIQRSVSGIVK